MLESGVTLDWIVTNSSFFFGNYVSNPIRSTTIQILRNVVSVIQCYFSAARCDEPSPYQLSQATINVFTKN